MEKKCISKGLRVGIIVSLIVVSTFISTAANAMIKKSSYIFFDGDILYVGGDGYGNYTKIQDAINAADSGDIIFVFNDSAPYYENVIIDKSIELVGEDRDSTIIDGNHKEFVIKILSDEVYIKGFTIQHGDIGLNIKGKENDYSNSQAIKSNCFKNNNIGVKFEYSSNNVFTNNIVQDNVQGIIVHVSSNDVIQYNHISNNDKEGIFLRNFEKFNTDVNSNNLRHIIINKNNLHNNNPSAYFKLGGIYSPSYSYTIAYRALRREASTLKFTKNYYEPDRKLPYPINGKIYLWSFSWLEDYEFNHKLYDLFPAKNPYDIEDCITPHDVQDALSDWATLEVTITRNKASYSSLSLWFLEQFPILHRLLSL